MEHSEATLAAKLRCENCRRRGFGWAKNQPNPWSLCRERWAFSEFVCSPLLCRSLVVASSFCPPLAPRDLSFGAVSLFFPSSYIGNFSRSCAAVASPCLVLDAELSGSPLLFCRLVSSGFSSLSSVTRLPLSRPQCPFPLPSLSCLCSRSPCVASAPAVFASHLLGPPSSRRGVMRRADPCRMWFLAGRSRPAIFLVILLELLASLPLSL